ncbi:hypothetical protein ACFCWT_13545 [Streptomyces olivaceus]|uniref:hypothetical protein n=1 Tax=Streptomyces olivaceus TaxID=47716 RepID=UPI0035E34600
MARKFTTGFEAGTEWTTTNGTPATTAALANSGTSSLRCNPATAVQASISQQIYPAPDTAAHVFMRAYVYVAAAPAAVTALMAWGSSATSIQGFYGVKLLPDRTLIITNSTGTTGGTPTSAIPLNTWVRLEFDYDDAADTGRLYIDGTLATSRTGIGLSGGNWARFGVINPTTADIYFDDLAVNDATGDANNGLPGAVMPPTGAVLGTATETSSALQAGRPFAELADTFDDGVVDPAKWPDSYESGGYSETGGRARVACTTAYNAFASAEAYRLAESSVHVQMWPPAAGGATVEAWAQLLIQTTTLGTDCVFEVSAISGNLVMASRVAYWDPDQVAIPYDPVAHAWLRLRETGGQLLWDTSPDGATWTTRRTATSPAWVADATLQVQLIAHRDGGTDDFAEFGSFNVTPGGGTEVPLVPAAESSSVQTVAGRKARELGTAIEAAAAQTAGARKVLLLGIAGETTGGRPLGRVRARALAVAQEAGSGHLLAGGKRTGITPAAGTDAARTLPVVKQYALAPAEVVEAARLVESAVSSGLALAGEAGAGRQFGQRKTRILPGAASAAVVRSLAGGKQQMLAPAAGATIARPVAWAKAQALGAAVESAGSRPVGQAKQAVLAPAASTSVARPLDVQAGLVSVDETSTARTLGRSKTTVLGTAGEVGEAWPFGRAKGAVLGGVAEAATARPLTGGHRQALAPAEETSLVLGLGGARARRLPAAVDVSEAGLLAVGAVTALDRARETTTVGPVTGRKTQHLPDVVGREAAQPLMGRKTLPLTAATEHGRAYGLASAKRLLLGAAVEADRAQQLLIPGHAATAEEYSTARPLGAAKRTLLAPGTEAALTKGAAGQKTRTLGPAVDTATARPAPSKKARALAAAGTATEAGQLDGSSRAHLSVATETARALIGPAIRLTWAAERDEARPLVGQRQRPADDLDATTSGPVLSPGAAGPSLTARSSGPRLVATTTTGG